MLTARNSYTDVPLNCENFIALLGSIYGMNICRSESGVAGFMLQAARTVSATVRQL